MRMLADKTFRVAGIDPGTHRIGYAVLERRRAGIRLVSAETIAIPAKPAPADRLSAIERALRSRLRRDRPDTVALETLYFAANAKTAMAVAEARGVILLTARRVVPSIWEYPPSAVKIAVTSYGRSDKTQVRRAVAALLPRAQLPAGDDAIDAIAIALTAIAAPRTNRPRA